MRFFSLEHSPWAYRADFALYMAASMGMGALLMIEGPPAQRGILMVLALLGLISWPLIEYGLHRFVLHGLKPFSTWHAVHHKRPTALVCTPIILSGTLIIALVFVPALLLGDLWLGVALTFGLLTGYLGYAVTHHAIHHWRGESAWLIRRQQSHRLHHDPRQPRGHYGVTTSWWDEAMGTKPPTTPSKQRNTC